MTAVLCNGITTGTIVNINDHHENRLVIGEAGHQSERSTSFRQQPSLFTNLPPLEQRPLSRVVKGNTPGWLTVLPCGRKDTASPAPSSVTSWQYTMAASQVTSHLSAMDAAPNSPSSPGIVTGRGHRISQHTCTSCTVMLHAAWVSKLRSSTWRVHVVFACGVHGSGTLCRSIFECRRSFCALQTFLLPLTHNLAKVPPSAVPSTVFVAIDRSAQISQNCTRNRETHTHVWMLHRAPDRVALERSLERSFAAERILVVWSHFRLPIVVLMFIDSTLHTARVRAINLCTAFVLEQHGASLTAAQLAMLGITCHLKHNGRRCAKWPRTLALASLLSSSLLCKTLVTSLFLIKILCLGVMEG